MTTIAAFPSANLRTLVEHMLGGIPAVRWDTMPRPFVAPSGIGPLGYPIAGVTTRPAPDQTASGQGVSITLTLTSDVVIGIAEQDYADAPNGDNKLDVEAGALHKCTVTVKAECDATLDGTNTALSVVQRLATRLWYDANLTALKAIGLVLNNTGQTRASTGVWGNKQTNVALLELFMSYKVTDTGDATQAADWIETVTPLTGTIS